MTTFGKKTALSPTLGVTQPGVTACTNVLTGHSYTVLGRTDGGGFADLTAARYSDGSYQATLAENTMPVASVAGSDELVTMKPIIGSGHVADHSVVYSDHGNEIVVVWDIQNNVIYSSNRGGQVTGPAWDGTHVYWGELTTDPGVAGRFDLYRANADLTNVSLVNSIDYTDTEYIASFGLTTDHAILYPGVFGGFNTDIGHLPLDGSTGSINGIIPLTNSGFTATVAGANSSRGSVQFGGAGVGVVGNALDDEELIVPTGLIKDIQASVAAVCLPGSDEVLLMNTLGTSQASSGFWMMRIDATEDYTVCSDSLDIGIQLEETGTFDPRIQVPRD